MQAVRNIFWWLCFVALGICVQSLVPCLDALVVGLVILLQERDYRNLCWLLPLFVLLQEGIGTSPFGATIVWYALVCLIYRLLRWLLGLGNFFLVLLLAICLGGACFGLGWLFPALCRAFRSAGISGQEPDSGPLPARGLVAFDGHAAPGMLA